MDSVAWEDLADLCARERNRLLGEITLLKRQFGEAEIERDKAVAEVQSLEQKLREESEARLRFQTALEQIAPHGFGLDQKATDEERADYWAAQTLLLRRIARESLEWGKKDTEASAPSSAGDTV